MKARNNFIAEAVALKNKIDKLENQIYLNGTIKSFDDFRKLLFVVMGNYIVTDPSKHEITHSWLREEYIKNLPSVISNLQTAHEEVKELNDRVKHRSPHILKFGKFSQSIESIVTKQHTKSLINNATLILNYCSSDLAKIPVPSVGARHTLNYSNFKKPIKIDDSGELILLGFNEIKKRRVKRKKKITRAHDTRIKPK